MSKGEIYEFPLAANELSNLVEFFEGCIELCKTQEMLTVFDNNEIAGYMLNPYLARKE